MAKQDTHNGLTANEQVFLTRLKEKLEENGFTTEERGVYNAVARLLRGKGEATGDQIKETIGKAKQDLLETAVSGHEQAVKDETQYWKDIASYRDALQAAAKQDPSKVEIKLPRYPGTIEQFRKSHPDNLKQVESNLSEIEMPKIGIDALVREARLRDR